MRLSRKGEFSLFSGVYIRPGLFPQKLFSSLFVSTLKLSPLHLKWIIPNGWIEVYVAKLSPNLNSVLGINLCFHDNSLNWAWQSSAPFCFSNLSKSPCFFPFLFPFLPLPFFFVLMLITFPLVWNCVQDSVGLQLWTSKYQTQWSLLMYLPYSQVLLAIMWDTPGLNNSLV